jgi:nucleotide-binding universal stress UspA family protein
MQPLLTERAGPGTWRAIVKVAKERDARVVIVGSHGRSAVTSAVLGSVSHGVVNHCPRPVLVVPCSGDHLDPETRAQPGG